MRVRSTVTLATWTTGALAAAALAGAPAIAADLGGPSGRGMDRGSLKDAPVYTDPANRFYVALRGGAVFPGDTDFNLTALPVEVANKYDTGYFIAGAFGVHLDSVGLSGFRGDIEVGYSEADINSHTVGGAKFSGADATGTTGITYGMASIYYDFATGTAFKPFIGAGGGIADVSFDNHGVVIAPNVLNDNGLAYAYHLTAGLNIELAPSLNLELAYRYFGTTGAELTAFDGTKNEIDTQDHKIMVGIRQSF